MATTTTPTEEEQDTFSMADVQAFELSQGDKAESSAESAPEAEAKEPPAEQEPEASNFADAFKRATNDEKAPAEKPQEVEPGEPEPKSESRAAGDFKALKQERDTAKQEVESLRSRLKELEDKDVNAILEDVQKERDDLSERLKLAAIERHPDFHRKYNDRVASNIEQAKKVVGEEHAERVEKLLRMEDGDYRSAALEDLFGELPASKAAIMGAVLQRIGEVRAERDAALSNADETYRSIVEQQDAQQQAALKESNVLFDEIGSEASNLEAYQLRDNDEQWNAEVQRRTDLARSIFTGNNDVRELARASYMAAAAPFYRASLGESLEVNRRLREQLGGVNAASPSVTSNGGGGEGSAAKDKGFLDAFKELTQ